MGIYISHDHGEMEAMVIQDEPHQLLIDQLSARTLMGLMDRIEALLILRDTRNGICPSCGDDMGSYHVVFGQAGPAESMVMRGIFFRHNGYPSSVLSCFMNFQ